MEVFVVIPYINRRQAPTIFHYSRRCKRIDGHKLVERFLIEEVLTNYQEISGCSQCLSDSRY